MKKRKRKHPLHPKHQSILHNRHIRMTIWIVVVLMLAGIRAHGELSEILRKTGEVSVEILAFGLFETLLNV